MKSLLLAFAFLTRFPLPSVEPNEAERARSLAWFPLVGYALGALLAVVAHALVALGRPLVAGVAIVALLALATGALHLDGIADWFDALGGGRGDRERMLALMRDPHVGAHGATALCLVLLAKATLFAALVERAEAVPWLVMPAAARAAVVPILAVLPIARGDGLAWSLRPRRPLAPLVAAFACLAVPVGLLASLPLALATGSALGVAFAVGLWARARLGGVTGDVCGAAIELAELAFALAWLVAADPWEDRLAIGG